MTWWQPSVFCEAWVDQFHPVGQGKTTPWTIALAGAMSVMELMVKIARLPGGYSPGGYRNQRFLSSYRFWELGAWRLSSLPPMQGHLQGCAVRMPAHSTSGAAQHAHGDRRFEGHARTRKGLKKSLEETAQKPVIPCPTGTQKPQCFWWASDRATTFRNFFLDVEDFQQHFSTPSWFRLPDPEKLHCTKYLSANLPNLPSQAVANPYPQHSKTWKMCVPVNHKQSRYEGIDRFQKSVAIEGTLTWLSEPPPFLDY